MIGKAILLLAAVAVVVESRPNAKHNIPEAEQIALETSGELLAPPELVTRITNDLEQIRTKFPQVANVKHSPKWTAGEVIVSKTNQEKIDQVLGSSLGPAQSKSIFQNKIFLVTFDKPYNPIKVAETLKKELNIEKVEPNGIIGGSQGIKLTQGTPLNTYVFTSGSGDCQAGCINKKFYEFTVGPDADSATLVKEWGN